jgi:hypothetical protein
MLAEAFSFLPTLFDAELHPRHRRIRADARRKREECMINAVQFLEPLLSGDTEALVKMTKATLDARMTGEAVLKEDLTILKRDTR